MAQQFAEEQRRAEDTFEISLRVSRQHYLDILAVWRHCRQITPLKPSALRLEKLARVMREQLDRQNAPPIENDFSKESR
jgi:hypothetical protein